VRRHALLLLAVFVAPVAVPAAAHADAGPPPDLVVVDAPAAPSATAAAARDRVVARARAAQVATVDLSPAAPPAPVAAARLRDGIDAYDELRFDDALAALDAAADDAARTGAAGLATAELSDIFLYRGLVHTQRGDATRAWDDLVRAATIAPARTLDPLRFPTRAVEAFDRARVAVEKQPKARVTVDAAGCDAWLDGAAATTAELRAGDHFVRVACAGRLPWGERVAVTTDATLTPPAATAPPPPDSATIAALAQQRGAAAALVVVIAEDGRAVTAALRVVDAGGATDRRASVRIEGSDLAPLDAALDRAFAVELPAVVVRPEKKRWYRSPWLWAAVGAAATAAIVLPLTVGGDDGDSATLRPSGWSW
jgi:hypothetical protein